MSEIDAALEALADRPAHARYRHLATEHPDPAVRAQWSAHLIRKARSGRPSGPVRVDYGDGPTAPPGRPCCGG